MKSNRFLGAGGIVLMAVFAMGTLAQASTLSGDSLTTDGSLNTTDMQWGIIFETHWSTLPDLSFDACPVDECSDAEDAAFETSSSSSAVSAISASLTAAPEPATFVLVGLTLAILPLVRKRRS